MTEKTFPCPRCSCQFSSERDLQLHLDAWPGNKVEHQRALKAAHEEADFTQLTLHGGADRVVSQIAGLIVELKEKTGVCWVCQKHASVRWIEDCYMCEPCWEAWRRKKEKFR